MKKSLILTLLFTAAVLLSANVMGQRTCYSNDYMNQQIKENPRFAEKMQQIEKHTQLVLRNPVFKATGVITIPVHVIVVYANSSQNISDAQIQSQIDVLNKDYRKLNTDWPMTPAEFLTYVDDFEIEYTLQGIERHSNSRSSWGTNDLVKTTYPPYSPNNHLNFWVCNIGGGILGYAQFPGGSAATDGVVISPQYFGSSDYGSGFYLSSPFDKGRTATHEVGHWINLRHIWGDGTCATDYVDDTPFAEGPNYGCPTHPHYTCNSNDMFMNYMDYVDDLCMYMFTAGQKARARAIFEPGGARESFVNGGTVPCTVNACDGSISLSLTCDNYPDETSWTLVDATGTTIDQGSGYKTKGQVISKSWSLSEGQYTFTIYDAYGDGICCSYGNGSYTLKDGCNTTLKSGASFGSSEATIFCVPAGGTNTPPVAEANGPYTGVTGTAVTFSSSGSTDSDGSITGYLWNFGDNSTSTLQNPTHAYTTAGTYTVTLTVTDNGGATDSDQATCTITSGGGSTELSYSDFESGWGVWTDGGGDCSRYTSGTYAYGGNAAIDIQDNSSTASSFYMTSGVDVATPGYTSIVVDFYFYAVSMESGEDFWVQYYNGSAWQTVASYARGTSFNNGTFYHATVTILEASYTFPTNMKIRFMCDASDNNDDVYIDNIRITASSGSAKAIGIKAIEPVEILRSGAIEELSDDFRVYPNPAQNELTIDARIEDNSVAYIYSFNGALIRTINLTSEKTIIDINELSAGMYLIKVELGDEILVQKFIKE